MYFLPLDVPIYLVRVLFLSEKKIIDNPNYGEVVWNKILYWVVRLNLADQFVFSEKSIEYRTKSVYAVLHMFQFYWHFEIEEKNCFI